MKYVKTYESVDKFEKTREEFISILNLIPTIKDQIETYMKEFQTSEIYTSLYDKDFGEISSDPLEDFDDNDIDTVIDNIIEYDDDLSLSILMFELSISVNYSEDPHETINNNMNFWTKLKDISKNIKVIDLYKIDKNVDNKIFIQFIYKLENLSDVIDNLYQDIND